MIKALAIAAQWFQPEKTVDYGAIKGRSHMTSAPEGGRRARQTVNIVPIGCVNGTVARGRGFENLENFADVIC